MQTVSSRTGLLICIPTLNRPTSVEWAWSFKSLNPPINFNTNFMEVVGKPIDQARNMAAQAAIEQDAKYLFFVGDDTVVPAHALKQFIYRMEHDPTLGVVGGIYFSKSEPSAPLVFRGNGAGSYWDWKVGEYFECTGLGMDACMIRVDLLRQLGHSWFKTSDENQFIDGINKAEMWTEDLYFCKRVLEETNFKVMADAGVICTHVDAVGGKRYGIPAGSYPTRRLQTIKSLRAIDIGSGPIDRSEQFPEYDLVRADIREDCNPDYRCDVSMLPFASEEFDLVFSSHVLEHFRRAEWEEVLDEWCRIVKTGGKIYLCLPNIAWAAEQIVHGNLSNDVLNVLYGAQSYAYDFHYNGFTPQRLQKALEKRGFVLEDLQLLGYNILMKAIKGSGALKGSETVTVNNGDTVGMVAPPQVEVKVKVKDLSKAHGKRKDDKRVPNNPKRKH